MMVLESTTRRNHMKGYEIYLNDKPEQIREIEIIHPEIQLGEDKTHVCAIFLTKQECLDWQKREQEIWNEP